MVVELQAEKWTATPFCEILPAGADSDLHAFERMIGTDWPKPIRKMGAGIVALTPGVALHGPPVLTDLGANNPRAKVRSCSQFCSYAGWKSVASQ